ncbi:MAG: hypothetical protein K0S60_137 [Evtepia sp.]|jgi:hypothetical protein|nr:hypothetical protein [Evtepia sp.]
MPEDKQELNQKSYALDDILLEVSNWSSAKKLETDQTATEEVASPEEPTLPESEESGSAEQEVPAAPEQGEAESLPAVASTEDLQEASQAEEPDKETQETSRAEVPIEAPQESPQETQIETDPSKEVNKEALKEETQKGPLEVQPKAAPNNLIPLYPQKEAETIRELVLLAARRLRLWLRLRHDQATKPKFQLKKLKKPTSRFKLKDFPTLPPPPDRPPKELAQEYGNGLSSLRLQSTGILFCALILIILAFLCTTNAFPLPAFFKDTSTMSWISLAVFLVAVLLSGKVLGKGVQTLLKKIPGMETVATLACAAVLADGLTMLLTSVRPASLPLFAPAALILGFQMLGTYWKRQELRLTCRTASIASEPDLMTIEPSQWNGKAVYRRRPGSISGFGSQVQQEDAAERSFRFFVPILLVAALLCSLAATVLQKHPNLFFWSLSATLIAASTLSGCLCFSMPFRGLSRRLSKLGVALAGWPGVQNARASSGLLIEDTDLFPPGYIELSSYRLFGGFGPEKVLSVTASLIRASGSGLDPVFDTLLRTETGRYVTVTELEVQNDGISAHVFGETVLVGNLSFLERMGIDIPVGVRVKTGVFCAIDDSFAGQFILTYSMHKTFPPVMDALTSNRIIPVLIALDFNLVPSVLRRLFRFPWDKMAFPDLSQREKLLRAPLPRETSLLAVLCLEGLTPLATAAAGAQRLQTAVRLCSGLACLGAFIGVLLAFYLSVAGALSALSAVSLSLFLLLWFLPTLLISGWVNQF